MPENSSHAYSNARLRQSLNFALTALDRRDISPRSEKYYNHFRNEVTAALDAETRFERLKQIGKVIAMEHLIVTTPHLKPENFSRASEVKAALLELREMQYLARYGDYLEITAGQVRLHAGASKLPGWETISGKYQWTEIWQMLEAEEVRFMEAEEGSLRPSVDGPYPMHLAIKNACTSMGYDFDFIKWSIHTYVKRNVTFHEDLEGLIARRKFIQLAHALFQDLRDIWWVFSESRSQTNLKHLEAVILDHIDCWFDCSLDRENPEAWIVRRALSDASRKARQKKACAQKREEDEDEEDKEEEEEEEEKEEESIGCQYN